MQKPRVFGVFFTLHGGMRAPKVGVSARRRTHLSGSLRHKHFGQKLAAHAFWIEIVFRAPPREIGMEEEIRIKSTASRSQTSKILFGIERLVGNRHTNS
jgi:hypothetical protein